MSRSTLITAGLAAMMRPESEEEEATYSYFAADLDDDLSRSSVSVHRK